MEDVMMNDMSVEPAPSEGTDVEGTEDLSQGYCIRLEVRPDGYAVSDPEPLPPGPSDESEPEYERVPDLTTALKHVLAVIKANPLGENPSDQLEAGYSA